MPSGRETMSDAALHRRFAALLAGDPAALADPLVCYLAIGRRGRVWRHEGVVVVTRHADVQDVLTDAATYSSRGLVEGSRVNAARSTMTGAAREAFDEVVAFQANFVSRTDDDRHQRLRRVSHRAFTPKRVAELGDLARTEVRRLLEEAADQPQPDLMRLASELPLTMVMALLDVPEQDRPEIQRWSAALSASNGAMEPSVFFAARDALREFRSYVDRRLDAAASRGDTSDLLSLLVDAGADDRLDGDELAAMFVQLLFAGHETTAGLIGIGLRELLADREQWRKVVDGSADMGNTVEELMRVVSPSQFATRLVRRPVVIDGMEIAVGQTVMAVIAAANRDPDVFADPDRLDVGRSEARRHLGFGFGPHFCLGAALARLEARVVLEELAKLHPTAALVDGSTTWSGGAMLRHLDRLRVQLD